MCVCVCVCVCECIYVNIFLGIEVFLMQQTDWKF